MSSFKEDINSSLYGHLDFNVSDDEIGLHQGPSFSQNWMERNLIWKFRVWHIIFLSFGGLLSVVILICCFIPFRIPRTKQEIEADSHRRKIANKFKKKLEMLSKEDLEELNLKKGISLQDFTVEKVLEKRKKSQTEDSASSDGRKPFHADLTYGIGCVPRSQRRFWSQVKPSRWTTKHLKIKAVYDVTNPAFAPVKLKLRPGEVQIDSFAPVEDTKGNAGDAGKLILTNLRVMWHSIAHPRVNLSIGHDTVVHTSARTINSVLGGITRAVYILTKVPGGTRFEFIFNAIGYCGERMLDAITGVQKSYNSSKVYRELKLRTALFENKRLKLGNLGTLILTNIRLLWYSELNELFNLSLPYLKLATVRVRDSKFGRALVVETSSSSGGYVLGFRIDSPNGSSSSEVLEEKVREITALRDSHGKCPDFGVRYETSKKNTDMTDDHMGNRDVDDADVVDDQEESDSFAAYFADLGGKQSDRDPIYDPDLGLAVERLKDGFTLESLWNVSSLSSTID
ncbi:unnamed protein product [Notodromas monacha]|uniref:BBSome complex member BBS5 PH domain-containing protein n=1 Tax=Notodromas monacha TaxID=399045 RepID=A0A7R9BLZ7_9CRUS|nr:unnamed protein product [Notodromas monacha]CAG0916857.1 unnamed protein product [Notodromas monacha]